MADAGFGHIFNPDAAVEAYRAQLDQREASAAQHLLAAMQARAPAERGKRERRPGDQTRASMSVQLTDEGFILWVKQYYAWFVEKGHKVGSRRTARASVLRQYAKELRRVRKATGDESLKEREKAFRKEATRLNRLQKETRPFVEGLHFVQRTIDEERENVIRILSGG